MKRVLLFAATNIAILVVLSITLSILGVDRILDEQGVNLDLRALLIFLQCLVWAVRLFPWPCPNGLQSG
jgi:hypothetical protein